MAKPKVDLARAVALATAQGKGVPGSASLELERAQ